MYDVYVSVGSNIEPRDHVVDALLDLAACEAVTLRGISPVYRTRPVDVAGEASPFHNLCLHLRTARAPDRLKRILRRQEDRQGRERSRPDEGTYASRVLDLDILLYRPPPEGFERHPQVEAESFVVYPLSDLLDPGGMEGLPSNRAVWRERCDTGDILGRVEYDWPEALRPKLVPARNDLR